MRYHYLKRFGPEGLINTQRVSSKENLADRPLPKVIDNALRKLFGTNTEYKCDEQSVGELFGVTSPVFEQLTNAK